MVDGTTADMEVVVCGAGEHAPGSAPYRVLVENRWGRSEVNNPELVGCCGAAYREANKGHRTDVSPLAPRRRWEDCSSNRGRPTRDVMTLTRQVCGAFVPGAPTTLSPRRRC